MQVYTHSYATPLHTYHILEYEKSWTVSYVEIGESKPTKFKFEKKDYPNMNALKNAILIHIEKRI